MRFPRNVGVYDFPDQNGALVVYGNKVWMNTRENGSAYENPRVYLKNEMSDYFCLDDDL